MASDMKTAAAMPGGRYDWRLSAALAARERDGRDDVLQSTKNIVTSSRRRIEYLKAPQGAERF